MSGPLSPSSIIFPSASANFNETLSSLKRSNLSIQNRLTSILHDAEFVTRTAQRFQLPLIANERCGSWYVRPDLKQGSAYFKSTDGHFRQWSFSLRRLNLQILDIIGAFGGCIIVDSTRKGKSMPDALSKTIPIWISVMNRLLFPERSDVHALRTPPDVVSESEHSQIDGRIDLFVDQVRGLQLDVESLRKTLGTRPLCPIWITPAGRQISPEVQAAESYHSVVLCTASSSDTDRDRRDYVQGAADDHESWGQGLDALLFWNNLKQLMDTPESDLPELITGLAVDCKPKALAMMPILVGPTKNIWIGDDLSAEVMCAEFDLIVSCNSVASDQLRERLKARYLHLSCPSGKFGSRQLRMELPKLHSISSQLGPGSKVLITCPTGKDLAVGAALGLMCLYFNGTGGLEVNQAPVANKPDIKHRLSWIMVSIPDASPSRATLQSVNAFLMG